MNRPRLVLADDHPAILAKYRELLLTCCEPLDAVQDGAALLAAAERWKPDIVVLDISMPVMNGVEACRRLRKADPGIRAIIVSSHSAPVYLTEAFVAGAFGYVLKPHAATDLPHAVLRVSEGQFYISAALLPNLWDDNHAGPERVDRLTERQRELLALTARGLSTKEIAVAMNMSFQSVVRRRMAAMRRLEINRRTDFLRFAIRCRLGPI